MPKMKDKLIQTIERYVDSKVLPATYRALCTVYMKVCNDEMPPSQDEWYAMILEEMTEKEAND